MCSYSLFRHRDKQDLVCAVPEDCSVPGLVAEKVWSFDRKLTNPAAAPTGFDPTAASHGVRFNGLAARLGPYVCVRRTRFIGHTLAVVTKKWALRPTATAL